MFRHACIPENGESVDPAVFVTATPTWFTGDEFETTLGERYRIVGVQMPSDEAEELKGVWTLRTVRTR